MLKLDILLKIHNVNFSMVSDQPNIIFIGCAVLCSNVELIMQYILRSVDLSVFFFDWLANIFLQIPSWFEAEGPTKYNPFTLPEVYWASQRKKVHLQSKFIFASFTR